MKRLLLISNSTKLGEGYLEYPKFEIKNFLDSNPVKCNNIIFIPYAGVTISYKDYVSRVRERFNEIGYEIIGINEVTDIMRAIEEANAIVVGGGNSFVLVDMLHKNKLIDIVRKKVLDGMPYIGWSAGANVACPTIKTTNDMPIIEPISMAGFNLVPFQINPHYTEARLPNHAGETRVQRIEEFIVLNRDMPVVGLPEGCMLRIEGEDIKVIGQGEVKLFKYGNNTVVYRERDLISIN